MYNIMYKKNSLRRLKVLFTWNIKFHKDIVRYFTAFQARTDNKEKVESFTVKECANCESATITSIHIVIYILNLYRCSRISQV